MSSTPDPILFNPPDHAIDAVVAALSDPAASLAHVAAAHNTTPDALALWLARPDIIARIHNHESALATRLRLQASNRLPFALDVVTKIITDFNARPTAPPAPHVASESSPPASTSNIPHPPSDIASAALACRATTILLRLAHYHPARRPHQPVTPARPSQRTSYEDTHAPNRSSPAERLDRYGAYPAPSPFAPTPPAPISSDTSEPSVLLVPSVPSVPSVLSAPVPAAPADTVAPAPDVAPTQHSPEHPTLPADLDLPPLELDPELNIDLKDLDELDDLDGLHDSEHLDHDLLLALTGKLTLISSHPP